MYSTNIEHTNQMPLGALQGLPFCLHLLQHKFYSNMDFYNAAQVEPGFDLTA